MLPMIFVLEKNYGINPKITIYMDQTENADKWKNLT